MSKSAVTALFLSLVVGQGFYQDLLLAKTPPTFEDCFSNENTFVTKDPTPITALKEREVGFCHAVTHEEKFLLSSSPYFYLFRVASSFVVRLPDALPYSLTFFEKDPLITSLCPKKEESAVYIVENSVSPSFSEMTPVFSVHLQPQKISLSEAVYLGHRKLSFYEAPSLLITTPSLKNLSIFPVATRYTPSLEPTLRYLIASFFSFSSTSRETPRMQVAITPWAPLLNEVKLDPIDLPLHSTLKDYGLEISLLALEIASPSVIDSFEKIADASDVDAISTETFTTNRSPRFRAPSKKGNKNTLSKALRVSYYQAKQILSRLNTKPENELAAFLNVDPFATISCELESNFSSDFSYNLDLTPIKELSVASPSLSKASTFCALDNSLPISDLKPIKYESTSEIKKLRSSSEPTTHSISNPITCTKQSQTHLALSLAPCDIQLSMHQTTLDKVVFVYNSYYQTLYGSARHDQYRKVQLTPPSVQSFDNEIADQMLSIALKTSHIYKMKTFDLAPLTIHSTTPSFTPDKLTISLPEVVLSPDCSELPFIITMNRSPHSFHINGKKETLPNLYDEDLNPLNFTPLANSSLFVFSFEKDSWYFYAPSSLFKTTRPIITFNIGAPDCEFVHFMKEIEIAQNFLPQKRNEEPNQISFPTKNPLLLSGLSPSITESDYATIAMKQYSLFPKTIFLVDDSSLKSSILNAKNLNQKYRVIAGELSNTPSLEELNTYNFSEEFLGKVQIAAKPDGSGYYFSLDIKPMSSERLTPIKQNIYFIIDKNRTTDRYLIESYQASIKQTLPYIYSDDAYNVYVYDGTLQKMEPEPVYRLESSIDKITKFISKQAASFRYSTKNINALLDEINAVASNYPSDVNTVVLFTNGAGLYSANKENQERIYAKLPSYRKTFSIYPAVVKKSANIRGLEKLSEVYRGKCIVSSTYSGLPRNVGKQVKLLQRPVIKDLHVTPITKGKQSVKIFPDAAHFPEIFSQSSTVIYGFTNSIQAFELFLQGSIQDEWMNARIPIYIDSAENGGSHLRKKCMALESKAKHLSQL